MPAATKATPSPDRREGFSRSTSTLSMNTKSVRAPLEGKVRLLVRVQRYEPQEHTSKHARESRKKSYLYPVPRIVFLSEFAPERGENTPACSS